MKIRNKYRRSSIYLVVATRRKNRKWEDGFIKFSRRKTLASRIKLPVSWGGDCIYPKKGPETENFPSYVEGQERPKK